MGGLRKQWGRIPLRVQEKNMVRVEGGKSKLTSYSVDYHGGWQNEFCIFRVGKISKFSGWTTSIT